MSARETVWAEYAQRSTALLVADQRPTRVIVEDVGVTAEELKAALAADAPLPSEEVRTRVIRWVHSQERTLRAVREFVDGGYSIGAAIGHINAGGGMQVHSSPLYVEAWLEKHPDPEPRR